MSIPALTFAREARKRAETRIPYAKEDCQAFVEATLQSAGGGRHDWSGSNHMFRSACSLTSAITTEPEVGALLFKARAPGEAKYNLPARYKKGGDRYNGDLNDYYHVGIYLGNGMVAHSTTASGIDGTRVDTSLSSWGYYGLCWYVDYGRTVSAVDRNILDAIEAFRDALTDNPSQVIELANDILRRYNNGDS